MRRFCANGAEIHDLVGFVDDLAAENLLQHVLERDDARQSAELVDDGAQMLPALEKISQQLVERRRVGDEMDRPHQLLDRLLEFVVGDSGEDVHPMDDAHEILVIVVGVDRHPAVPVQLRVLSRVSCRALGTQCERRPNVVS